jgi:hypothetical protein
LKRFLEDSRLTRIDCNVDVKGSINVCFQKCWEEGCADMFFEEVRVLDDGGVAETGTTDLIANMG